MVEPGTSALTAAPPASRPSLARGPSWPAIGLMTGLVLILIAAVVPPLFGWTVHALGIAPVSARWDPRVGWGTGPALLLGIATVRWAPQLAGSLRWRRLLAGSFVLGAGWLSALATVDGWHGIGHVLGTNDEYLPTARRVTSISALLHEFVARIPATSASPWPTHVAGHPPGALLFFIALVRSGLGGGLAAGWVVVLIAATTPLAVLVALRALGAESSARRVAPVLVVGPAAIWTAVSADAMFAAVAAWALCALAIAATARGTRAMIGWSLCAGLLFGACLLLSYGLALLAVPALAVLLIARNPRPLLGAVAGVLVVVLGCAAAGFLWWQGFTALHGRYYAGLARVRPAAYWVWADLAALCVCAGPLLGASIGVVAQRARRLRALDGPDRTVVLLTLAACACIGLADLSFMSKAETERIWLPFVPWLLLGAALLPEAWRRRALAGQVTVALLVQTLLFTHW
ncbi:MAG: hypothetical protein ABI301_01945 [Jatrophihabitantaceae bacterium]